MGRWPKRWKGGPPAESREAKELWGEAVLPGGD